MESYLKIEDIESVEVVHEDYVYDLSIKDNHNYFINAGKEILVHNSSKTWDFFHFLVIYCDNNRNQENEIYILRETLTDCKDYTFKEFQKCLKVIGIWDDDKYKNPQKPYYNLFGNHVYFRGLDDSSEGYPSDICFINEALENKNKEKVEGLDMRCRKLMVLDWNPKYSEHWCFDLEGQPNVFFTKSTYKNNKHLEESVIRKIESYEPTEENIKNKTADKYRWAVYGLGQRASPKGLIFKNYEWIDKLPNIGYWYGLDFGFTNDPTVLVRFCMDRNNIYAEPLLYQPVENPKLLNQVLISLKIEKHIPIIADSSDRYAGDKGSFEMVKELKKLNWKISKVSKRKTLIFWIEKMQEKNINIVKNSLFDEVKKEVQNYKWNEVNGIFVNSPVDEYNHFWDATRYALMGPSNNSITIN